MSKRIKRKAASPRSSAQATGKPSAAAKAKRPALKVAEQKIRRLEDELERAKKVTIDVLDAEIGRSKKIAVEVRQQLKKIQDDGS